MLNEMESENPQMYEAMYNIQAQALTPSGPHQARDSGTVIFKALHLHIGSLLVYSKMCNIVFISLFRLLWIASFDLL